MSDFECRKGHPLKSGEYVCPICGEKLARMDGMSNSELRKLESMDCDYIDDQYEDDEDVDQ